LYLMVPKNSSQKISIRICLRIEAATLRLAQHMYKRILIERAVHGRVHKVIHQ